MEGESRIYSNPGKPVLIYLPGVHGDPTLFTSFRIKAAQHLQIVEFTYPRTVSWSLTEYADFVLRELNRHGLKRGWLVAESYSSQVAWAMLERAAGADFFVEGIILAGGFVRYPIPTLARTCENRSPFALEVSFFGLRLVCPVSTPACS